MKVAGSGVPLAGANPKEIMKCNAHSAHSRETESLGSCHSRNDHKRTKERGISRVFNRADFQSWEEHHGCSNVAYSQKSALGLLVELHLEVLLSSVLVSYTPRRWLSPSPLVMHLFSSLVTTDFASSNPSSPRASSSRLPEM
ncbi:hypothetical protein R1flu_004629 [Riccia fluitans]|uniref:Uncharacterized protein n=1 Tax=Riccia fluitans TaxID=41844 RepID=A0ABD1YR81_9MARC